MDLGLILGSQVFRVVVTILVVLVLLVVVILNTWKKIPNDHAGVIVGLGKPKVVTGGGVMVIPLLQRIDTITLETISIHPSIRGVKTSLGVPINTDGYILIKVKADASDILTAMQMFYCDNEKDTKDKITEQTQKLCEGKLREIVSGMTVEEIYDDRAALSKRVLEIAEKDLESLGLELKGFTINDISDEEGYIESLGKAQIAKVKAEAAIAQSEAIRDQTIKTAEANRISQEAKLAAETQIAQATKEKELRVLGFKREQETQQAKSDAAYTIQENITKKDITNTKMDADILESQRTKEVREAEIQVQITAEQKGIELAEKQAQRKEVDLMVSVIKPAEAKQRETELEAEAEKIKNIKKAEADAEAKTLDATAQASVIKKQGEAEADAIRARGLAEAEAIKAKGLAEAEALEKRAEALAKMDDAGRLQMVMDKLPEIARAVAEPMSRIGSISIIGGSQDDGAANIARNTVAALSAVTKAVKDTVGFDLTKVMEAQTIDAQTVRKVELSGTVQTPPIQAPKGKKTDQ